MIGKYVYFAGMRILIMEGENTNNKEENKKISKVFPNSVETGILQKESEAKPFQN